MARLRFTEAEEEQRAQDMSRILDHMDKLHSLDTTGVPPMSHVLDLHNVTREDEIEERVDRDDALSSAPDPDGTYFRMPKVIE